MKILNIPMAAKAQNDRRVGMDEVAPIPKAMKLVTDVTVIALPACDIVDPILSTTDLDFSFSSRVSLHWTITNTSSIPTPSRRKGITV